jgi:hypothetical protein
MRPSFARRYSFGTPASSASDQFFNASKIFSAAAVALSTSVNARGSRWNGDFLFG